MHAHAYDLVLLLFLLPCVASRVTGRVHVVGYKGRDDGLFVPGAGVLPAAGLAVKTGLATALPDFRASTHETSRTRMAPPVMQVGRRNAIARTLAVLPSALAALLAPPAWSAERADLPALKGKDYGKTQMSYSDFAMTDSGLMYKDATVGSGKSPAEGDRVVVDWSGYTIGYNGRPFETKKLVELDGKEKDPIRFELGRGLVVPGMEEGLLGMKEGGVRQLVVVPELGYPSKDASHNFVGPKPSTFSGQRALNFVIYNQELLDKTLLFNVKLIRVDKPGQNGWVRGRDIPEDGFWR